MASVLPGSDETTRESDVIRPPIRKWTLALGATFLAGLFVLTFRLEEARSLGSHEGYAIVPAREMLLTGDYLVPRFGDLPRLKKPPLIYWTIASAAALSGGLDLWTARLPAVFAGLALAGLMARWAFRWYGGVAAVGAAAAQLSSVYVLVFARKAEADMILVFLIAAALYLVGDADPAESRRRRSLRWMAIWGLVAISWLGKFHFGPAMILAPAIAWLVLERRWRSLSGLFSPLGLLLVALVVGVWPALVLQRLPGAWTIWQEETIGRAVGELGRQPVWYYVPHLVTWTLPWTLFAVLAWPASWRDAWRGLRRSRGDAGDIEPAGRMVLWANRLWERVVREGDSRERLLWVWLGVAFLLVSASANKHPHYILPALPAFSLWTGRRFAQLAWQALEGRRLVSASLAAILTAVSVVGLLGLIAFRSRLPEEVPAMALLSSAAIAAGGTTAAAWLTYLRRNWSAFTVTAVAGVAIWSIAAMSLLPAADHRRGAYAFAREIRTRYGSGVEIGVYGLDQDAVVWYLGEPVFRAEAEGQLAAHLEARAGIPVLTTAVRTPELARVGETKVLEEFTDRPGLPKVRLGHYRGMQLVEITAPVRSSSSAGRSASTAKR